MSSIKNVKNYSLEEIKVLLKNRYYLLEATQHRELCKDKIYQSLLKEYLHRVFLEHLKK